nr:Chain AA, Linker4 [Porphyridium purpureum]7Y7A_AW Chain AW, Linker4 [Porphyridium purpureum]7Y7A_EA Chain EA, Linker4 [Porphyridium purpureum]7Y7A_EW Chain EW, Linker4 [Porphyridium purpureum]
DVVNAAYPKNIKNKAPVISFDGKKGVKLEMVTLQTFAGDDSEDTLFDYSSGKFMPQKPADMGIAWPSGDGRQAEMKGGKGSFNQPDLRKYGPFPDFLKRSMDL